MTVCHKVNSYLLNCLLIALSKKLIKLFYSTRVMNFMFVKFRKLSLSTNESIKKIINIMYSFIYSLEKVFVM